MRRVLSLVLALLMVITCLTGLSLISVSADGTAGTITVFKQDYENGTLPEGNNGAINSIKDDGTGNHYGAVTLDANGLAGSPAASDSDRRPGVALGYRLRAGKNVPYISGKHYTLSWDLGSVNGGKVTPVGAGTSGIEGMGTNKLFGFRDGTNQAFSQYYFSLNALTEEGGTAANHTAENLSSGWRRNVATGINYKLTTSDKDLTIVPDGTVGSVTNFFFEVGIADTLLKLMVDNQAYWGVGFVKNDKTKDPLTGYTFTLDADHVYGDEACIGSEKYPTKESLVGTEWSLGQDCSGLKSDKRTAAFQKVLDDLNIAFGMDNVEWKAETTYYEDTVNITGDASVTAVTNTGVGCEASEAVANGGKVTVNDYFGTKYEITAESKPVVKYNGVAVEAKADGSKYTVTIPASSVTKNGTLDITVSDSSEQMIEIYKEDFNGFAAGALSGGWGIASSSQYYQSGFEKDSTGNTYLVMKDWNADEIVKLFVNKSGNLQEIYPRVQISKPPYKFDIGREYTLSFKYKYTDKGATIDNVAQAQPFFNFTGGSVNKWGKGWSTWVPNETTNYTQFYSGVSAPKGEDGWRAVSAPAFKAEEAYTKRVDGTPIDEIGLGNNQFEFKGLTNGNDINAYPIVKLAKEAVDANTTDGTVDQAAAAKALAASLKEHDYKICLDDVVVTTMAETKKVTVTADEGAEVTVNSKSVASGSKVSVPVDFESNIAVSAKAGYVIDTVTIDGKKQEVAANSTSYNTAYVFTGASSSIAVTTKAAASYEVAVTLGAGGTLKINNKDVKNGDKINVIDGTETTVAVKPDDGKKIDYVKIDGAAKEIPAGGGTIKHTFTKAGTIEVAFKEAGKVEGVLVYSEDFEGEHKYSGGTAVEAEGENHYYTLKNLNGADAAMTSGKDKRPGSEAWQFRFNTGDKLKYINGKTYSMIWKQRVKKDGSYYAVARGSSGFNSFSGGYLKTYSGDTPQKTSQWYSQGNTGPGGVRTVKDVNNYDAATGWTTLGFTGISYGVWDGSSDVEFVTVNGLFMQSNFYTHIAKLLVDNKAYMGTGLKQAEGYKFTITDADIYGDEEGLKENGGKLTKEQLCKEWNFSMDCSPLKSAKRQAAINKAFSDAGLELQLDDVEIRADASVYNIPVKINGKAEVKAVTNTYTNDATTLTANGTIAANDYYGVTITVKPTGGDKDSVKSITYGGEELAFEDPANAVVTIPANKVDAKELAVNIETITDKTPVVSDVKITGDKTVGSTLTASYTYTCADADASTYQWQKLVDDAWTDIAGATEKTYVTKAEDNAANIRIAVDAKSAAGATWKRVYSAPFFVGELAYFVAPNGNDATGDGTIGKPYATMQAAKEKIKALIAADALPAGEVIVYFRGGRYPITETINFTAADSGNENTTIIYKAYNNENVDFVGSQKISANKISKVTEDDKDKYGNKILDRIIDEQAKGKLYKIDLSEYTGTIPSIPEYGWNSNGSPIYNSSWSAMDLIVNNERLTDARWPNDEPDTAMVLSERVVCADQTQPSKVGYPDPTGRTALWNAQAVADDGMVDLHVAYHWYSNIYKIGSIDAADKSFMTKYGTSYKTASNLPLYFFNILEEIDMPGESFIDRERKIAYFYPTHPIDGTEEIELSTFNGVMITMSGAKYITFDGINFRNSRGTFINTSGLDHVTINDSVMAHGGRNAANLSGYNITVNGCHIYDTGYGGINISGGDRNKLVSSNNVISNCIFSDNARTKTSYSPAVSMGGVGVKVSGNIIYNNQHEAITFSGNDHVMEYNEIYNTVKEHGDMGAIYWGRDPSVLGIVIRNNYFHDNGNLYNGGWNQSIFGDDGNFGADIYDNVFYRATLTEDRGGHTSSYPIKTNGGQYYNVHNNIFVDNPCSTYFQSWVGSSAVMDFKSPMQGQYITYNYDCKPNESNGSWSFNVNGSQWNKIKNFCDNDAWKAHYKDTMWEPFFDNFSAEKAEKMFAFANAKDFKGMTEYVKTFAPSKSNTFDNNINVKNLSNRPEGISRTENEVVTNNYASKTGTTSSGASIFKDYGKDFSLTDEGLAEVRKTATGFKNIDMSSIGIDYDENCTGYAPKATDAKLIGNPAVGGTLKATYTFTDPDGDSEGHSVFAWYAAEKIDGVYTRVLGKGDREMLVSEELAGKFVKYTMIPYDRDNRYGPMVESAPVQISAGGVTVDKSELSKVLEEADALIKSAVVGDQDGMYPQEALDAFKAEFNKAADVFAAADVYQYQINNAVKALKNAIDTFKLSQISNLEYLNIKELLKDTAGWTQAVGDSAKFENGKLIIPVGNKILYTKETYLNKIFTFRIRFETTDDKAVTKINDTDFSHKVNAAIYARSVGYDGQIWSNSNKGFLMWFHNDTYEAQEWKPAQTTPFYSAANKFFTEYNKDYEIAFGAVDTADGVRLLIYVDNELVYDEVYGNSLLGQMGALGFGNHGDAGDNVNVVISPAEVDFTKLNAAIAEAEGFLAKAEIGSGYGQYPADKKAALEKAIADGKATVSDSFTTQLSADRQTLTIEQALSAMKASANGSVSVSSDTTFDVNYDIDNADFDVTNNAKVTLNLDKDKLTPEIKSNTSTEKGNVTMDIPEGSKLDGDKINTPIYKGTTPSGTISGGITVEGVYSAADTAVTSDRLVRFSFPGAKNKRVYYKDTNGKYVEVTAKAAEDTSAAAKTAIGSGYGAAKITVGDNLVVWTNYITEFVIFKAGVSDNGNDDYNGNDNSGTGGVTKPSAGNGSNGFYSTETTNPNIDNPFTDMVNHWAAADVMAMNKAGIVSGVSATLFDPDRNITRAEFAAIISRALKLADKAAGFKDVNDEWFAPYVGACADAGIITGYDGYFRPNDNITRQEMAVIIVNAYSYLGKAGANGGIDNFSDKWAIADWAKAAVDTASSVGLISGMGDGTFAPGANATRAQAASLIYRLIK